MRDVISHCVNTSQQDLARERTAELRRWTLLAEELKETDNMLLESLSSRRREILRGKRLCLLEQLLNDAGHQDTNLVKDIAEGFDLTGPLPEAKVFKKKFRPATIACSELRKIAASCRKAMLSSVSGSGDADLDRGLIDATKKEVVKGYLVGPIDESSMPEGATLTRRFPVKQRNKVRPIDDYRSSMVNSSVTQTEGVTVHTIDHISAMIALWMRLSAESREDTGLKAKCWDLSDAYKQFPLSDHAFDHDAFLVVFDPDSQSPCIYQQKVLPFGSIASVTSFLRLSLALWKLGSALLNIAWSSYFDDFLSLAEAGMERHTDMVITFLFSTLGWRLATEKLVDFDSVCKVLGVKLDLSEAHLGTTTVMNTPERVDELIADIDQILRSGMLTRREGERLRGRLQFASSQLFGRVIRNYMRQLSKHIASGRRTLGDEVKRALASVRDRILKNTPRKISGRLSDYVHLYVDASFEPEGFSGVGGVLYDSFGKCLGFFSEEVDQCLMSEVMQEGQKTVIQELEALGLLAGVSIFGDTLACTRVVVFTDSESVRGAFLKCWSVNENASRVLRQTFEMEDTLQVQLWLERVPSQSNPADPFSREVVEVFQGLQRSRCNLHEVWRKAVKNLG
eukprot:s575_g22.t1